jgi:Ca-activated chloride channel family protein
MITLDWNSLLHPWCLLLPVVYIIKECLAFIMRRRREEVTTGIYFPSSELLNALPKSFRQIARGPVLFSLTLLTISLFSIAAARPQRITFVEQPEKGRNIVLVLDVSESMNAYDFPTNFGDVSRMEGVKTVVAEYVRSRTQDRVGLVVFGRSAYLQAPLTTDTALVGDLVQDLKPGVAGDGTAIGDGMGLGLKVIKDAEKGSKAIILLTDGVNNAGSVTPAKAARVAKDLGIPIHTIGIGVGTASLGTDIFGIWTRAEFDEKTLREIASLTGGVYFNAQSLDGLKKVYQEIDTLTEEEKDAPRKSIVDELFLPYLRLGAICCITLIFLAVTFFRRIP